MKKFIACLLIGAISFQSIYAFPLKRGTTVVVRLNTSANSNRETPITAEIAYDVDVAGETLIAKGTPVTLSVNKKKSKGTGRPGFLQISSIATTATDGQTVTLAGSIENEGDNRSGAAIGLGVGLGLTFLPIAGFAFLFMKGGKAEFPAGTTFQAYTTELYEITPR